MKFSGSWQWTNEQNFGGDPDHRLDTGIVFRIRHQWYQPTALRNAAVLGKHHHSNYMYDVITSPAIGGGMHCDRTQRTAYKVLFLALSDFSGSVGNISGTAERIPAKCTEKTCLIPRSDEFEGQGQKSKVKVTRDKKGHFSALSASCVWLMFGKTSSATTQ